MEAGRRYLSGAISWGVSVVEISAAIYGGSVGERLEEAERIVVEFGPGLRADSTFMAEIARLGHLAEMVNSQMAAMDLGPLCSKCAAEPAGGCCSLYMSGETDAVQLAMNLLVGAAVKVVREDGKECLFLGERGCLFLFKPMFCLNYLCQRIRLTASAQELAELERRTGRLLNQQYLVEQHILGVIRKSLSG